MKADLAASGERAPSYNDFVMKAVAYALQEHPNLNATYEDGVIRVYEDINLSLPLPWKMADNTGDQECR